MTKSFGKPPVLMSQVNPALRASVAQSVLKNNGYFRGNVTYETVTRHNPKKAKIAYTVHLDSLFTVDSMAYTGFPADMQQLIDSTASERLIKRGEPFSVAALDGERSRISHAAAQQRLLLLQSPSYASYLADTVCTAATRAAAPAAGRRTARRGPAQSGISAKSTCSSAARSANS